MISRFVECDTCRAKPGSPALCAGCVWNRWVIEKYEAALSHFNTGTRHAHDILDRVTKQHDSRE